MFKKELLWIDNIAIIDIWSYKIKVALCNFRKDEIEIKSYTEKRQEQDIILNWEIKDLKSLCENTKIALKKVDPKNTVKQIIINSVTPDIFISSSQVSYERKEIDLKIKKEEVFRIIKQKETECINIWVKNIKDKTPYHKEDLRLLLGNINSILIDWKKVMDIFWKTWKKIVLSITNIFIPNDKYEIIESIGKIINKEIISIIPEEYSITKLFDEKKELVVINIWNKHTIISIKKKDNIVFSTKISIWMNDLFKKIKDKKLIPTEKIIKNLEIDFEAERKVFLEALKDCIIAWLQELSAWKICPHKFFLTWWWWKSDFIREYIKKIDFEWNHIKMLKEVELIWSDFNLDEEEVEKIWTDNVNLLSMIFVAHKIFYDERTVVKDVLEEIVSEIE